MATPGRNILGKMMFKQLKIGYTTRNLNVWIEKRVINVETNTYV
jgi:hypothetical protein